MTGRTGAAIVLLVWCLSPSLIAKVSSVDNFLSWFSEEKKIPKKTKVFHGLKFAIDESHSSCMVQDPHTLCCKIADKAELCLQKKTMSSSLSIPLVRLARKDGWFRQYRLINQYVEESVATGLGAQVLQKAVGYHLDNILWPVLIRAFDVVIDEYTCISITTKCDFRDWPAVEKEISGIEASLSR